MLSAGLILMMPCGQCIGCRLRYSRNWAIRCMQESLSFENNCFITLTYRPEKLPPGGTLVLRDFQLFMKRLRKKYGAGIRVAYCGEYGDLKGRPHYHALLFNLDFQDKSLKFLSKRGDKVYESKSLDDLWTDPSDGVNYGNARIGDVTFESCAYVARYVCGKILGKRAGGFCREMDPETGEILDERLPEFFKTSRDRGIGRDWFERYRNDVFPNDFCLVRRDGKLIQCGVPPYYSRLYENFHPELYQGVRQKRLDSALKFSTDGTPERLAVREFIELEKIKLLTRSHDAEDVHDP